MARGFSRVILVGNLGRDPEMRYSASGTAIASFSIAVGRRARGQDGNWQDETDWYNVSVFGNNAETADKHLKKGNRVLVDGRLQLRKYTANDGTERQSVDVNTDNFLFLTGPDSGGDYATSGSRRSGGEQRDNDDQPQSRKEQKDEDFDDFDDVPF